MKRITLTMIAIISMTIGCVGEEQSIDDRYDTTTQRSGLRLMGSQGNECAYAGTVQCQSPWGGTTYHNHTEYYYVGAGESCPAAISVSWTFGDEGMGHCMGDVVLVNDLLDAVADEAASDDTKTVDDDQTATSQGKRPGRTSTGSITLKKGYIDNVKL